MGRELGRISGPLLAENLLRNGNNLAFDSKLIYLDVVNGYIGINTDTPTRNLLVDGTLDTTNLIVDTSATIADLEFTTDQIQNVTGGITFTPFQSVDPTVTVPKFKVSNLEFTNNSISNLTNGANIVLDTNGSGTVIFNTNKVDITGSLHATGDITWDGTITLGNNDLDNVTFNADVDSAIIPDANNTYDIGSAGREWRNLYAHDLKVTTFTTANLTVNNIDLLLTQGNTIYVSVNGSDTNIGTHLHGTYLTIAKALSVAVAGDEIVIFPGTYTEIFPLTVPQGVSVRGMDIRNVIVKPTSGTNTNNAFLMNGETTVSFLTVKDFYAPGNAFSFASNFTVTTRSSYVQNVTVITTGPNAGNGALVDGSLANTTSKEAAMLFHAVTMIVPDAIGIQATNGARVEWLNGFTYFANKGIYLTEGTLGFASLGVKFGAELRSIGSANVYGTYGAYADGASTLGYLISHNFGYIGSGLDSQNDYGLVEQSNEVVAINSGQLYYESTDQKGDFRIGDIFLVEQSTGNVSFNAQSINYTATGNITLEGPSGRTFIHAPAIEVDNIRIHDNNIDSMAGPVNFLAFSGSTYLNTNVVVTGNTDITGDTNIKGTLTTFGNEATDTVTVLDYLTQTIKPDLNNTYTLGKITGTEKRWNTLFATLINVDGVTQLTNNTITTLTTDTDLRLIASGSGIVEVTTTDVEITNNLTLVGSSDLQDVELLGTLNLPGSYTYTQIGNATRTGNTDITGHINVYGAHVVQFEDIKFDDNIIATTFGDHDLTFTADGDGIVNIINTNVQVTNNLSADLTGYFNSVDATNVTADAYDIDSVYITGNTITTNVTDTDLVLSADGSGEIQVTTTDVVITNDLEVNQLTTLTNVIIGSVATGSGLTIATNDSGGLSGWGAGVFAVAYNPIITTTYPVGSTITFQDNSTATITFIDDYGPLYLDIFFTPNKSGILFPITLSSGAVTGGPENLYLTGDYTWTHTGSSDRTGNTDITGTLTVNGAHTVQFEDIKFVGNLVTTTLLNSNLELTANGVTSIVKTLLTDVEITNDLDVDATADIDTLNATTVTANAYDIGSVYITGNTITTNVLDTNLVLSADGAGEIHVTTTDVEITNDLEVKQLSTLTNVDITGLLDLTGDYTWLHTGTTQRTGNTDITGTLTVNGANTVEFADIQIAGNTVKTTLGTDLELQANGSGIVKILTSDVEITNNLDVHDTGYIDEVVVINGVSPSDTDLDFVVGNISISGNTVTTTTGNLILTADNAGEIHVTTTDVEITNDLEVKQLSTFTNVDITGLLDLTGDWNQTGATQRIGNTDITGSLTVNGVHTVEFADIQIFGNTVKTTLGTDLELQANGTGIVKILTSDVEITNNLDVLGTGYLNEVVVINSVSPSDLDLDLYVDFISIVGNTITTTGPLNLILSADGAGEIHVTTTDVEITNDLEVKQLSTLTNVDITGLLDLTGDYTWTHTGASDRTGNTDITGTLTVNGDHYVQFQDINITNNVITTTVTDNDLILKAITPANIVNVVNTNVQVDLDLNVDLEIGANSVQVTQGVTADDFYIGDFYIKNTISIVPNNTNLILGATGVVKFKDSDVNIANDLTVTSDVRVVGSTSLKNTIIRSETLTPTTTQTAQNVSGTSTPTGFFFYGWADDPGQINPPFGIIQVGWSCVQIPGSVVTVVGDGVTNYDITITGGSFASGGFYSFTGNVTTYGPATLTQLGNIVQTGSTDITGNFQADSDISVTGPSSFLSVDSVKIDSNIISATVTDDDLELSANGIGGVRLERYIKITNSDISNVFDSNNLELAFNNLLLAEDGQNLILESGDFYLADTLLDGDLSIKFTPNGTGNLVINSNTAFAVAYGNNSDRVLKDVGEIRQNSTTKVYEGKLNVGVAKFNYLYDTDGNTYITPEATPGANDNTLRFSINGVEKATIDSTKLFSNTLYADNVSISGTTISNRVSTNDLILAPNGTGTVKVNNVSLAGNKITNNTNTALVFENNGTGYVKFAGTNGIVFPRGPALPPEITPELGETRFNTDNSTLEIFDGTNWIAASGSSNVATLEEITAEIDLWSLILG